MSEWVNVDVIDGVGPVALKRRRPAEDEAPLDHEAAVLSAIDHPGVVRMVELRKGPEPALVTHYIGTHSLATTVALGLDEAVAIIASLAETLADLHRLGVRHGAIDPSHVLLGPGRRPVLCGFSGATLPGTPVDVAPTPADDVAGVGRVMTCLVVGHDGLEPIPSRRSIRRRDWAGYLPRALLTLADHCQAEEAGTRPSAASLASTIGDLIESGHRRPSTSLTKWADWLGSVPSLVRGRISTWPWPHPGPQSGRRALALGLAITGLVAAGVAVRSLRASPTEASVSGSPAPEARAAAISDAPPAGDGVGEGNVGDPPTTIASPTTTAATEATAPDGPSEATCPLSAPTGGADTDGDGCPDGQALVDGHTVTVDGERFVLGREGDQVLVGDWDCDGLTTAVLVRSDPPAVWHFPAWAPVGDTVAAQLVSDEVDEVTVTVRPDGRGCDALFTRNVLSGDSTPIVVTP